jgi:hypothetical protein
MLRSTRFFTTPHKRKLLPGCLGVVCALLLLATPALASPSGQLLWVGTYRPTVGRADFSDVVATPRGGAYAVGERQRNDIQTLILAKYGRDGHRRWVRAFKGDYPRTLGLRCGRDGRGNVYVAGEFLPRSGVMSQTGGGVLLLKYAPDGARRWSRTWSGASPQAMVVDAGGNVYLAIKSDVGRGSSRISGLVVTKFDTHGKRLWAVRYRDPADPTGLGTIPFDLALDAQGTVYVAGACSFIDDHENDIYTATPLTLKFSGVDGSLLASAVYRASFPPYAVFSAIDVRGGTVAVCGRTRALVAQGLTMNYDLSLNQRYALAYQHSSSQIFPSDVALDPAGNTLVTSGFTVAFGPDGARLWQQVVDDGDLWIRVDEAGNSYVGASSPVAALEVTKRNVAGDIVWTQTWPAVAAKAATAHCFTVGMDGVYIGGQMFDGSRAVLAKFAP